MRNTAWDLVFKNFKMATTEHKSKHRALLSAGPGGDSTALSLEPGLLWSPPQQSMKSPVWISTGEGEVPLPVCRYLGKEEELGS